jgi:hypothetical protein
MRPDRWFPCLFLLLASAGILNAEPPKLRQFEPQTLAKWCSSSTLWTYFAGSPGPLSSRGESR